MSELSFVNVTVRYGHGRRAHTAVDDVTLTVPAGKVVGLVGESGSGKSTLARAAIAFVPLSSGRILVGGEAIRRAGRKRRPAVQMVFQDPYSSLDPRMTIGSSIMEAMPAAVRRDRSAARAETVRLLSLVNLDADRAAMLPKALSGGQRQRVALARALAAQPDVIIADEITAALDASVQGTVLNLVRDLQRDLELSMLFISHNLAVVRYVSDVVAVMYRGRVVEVGPTAQVLADPQHPYTRELIDAIPHRGSQLLATKPSDLTGGTEVEVEDPDRRIGCAFVERCPIGPLATPDRAVCLDTEPRLSQSDHAAACHFVEVRRATS